MKKYLIAFKVDEHHPFDKSKFEIGSKVVEWEDPIVDQKGLDKLCKHLVENVLKLSPGDGRRTLQVLAITPIPVI